VLVVQEDEEVAHVKGCPGTEEWHDGYVRKGLRGGRYRLARSPRTGGLETRNHNRMSDTNEEELPDTEALETSGPRRPAMMSERPYTGATLRFSREDWRPKKQGRGSSVAGRSMKRIGEDADGNPIVEDRRGGRYVQTRKGTRKIKENGQ